jgi:hypothetical protein
MSSSKKKKDIIEVVEYLEQTIHFLNGKIHREDGPAVERTNGSKEWRINGRLHRVDGPAVINTNGDKLWYKEGALHREDGPAVELADGRKEWRINGGWYREDGPAIIWPDGKKEWITKRNRTLRIIPKYVLEAYMKANNYTLAHLLTDPDPLVRKSASKYKWE